MKVLLIREDNHGVIGIAKDFVTAVNFLIENFWIDDDEEFYAMTVEEFNEVWDEAFFLEWYNVEGT